MKHLRFLLIVAPIALLIGCQKNTQTTSFTGNVPVYLSYEELRSAVVNQPDVELEQPGKIFLYNDLILINEFERGIHIYDNSNPSSPAKLNFVNIPGNVDMAVSNGVLYADSYVDLVALDLRDPKNVEEIGRAEDVLSYTISTRNFDDEYPLAKVDQTKGVIIDYNVQYVQESCENEACYDYYDVRWDNRPFENSTWGADESTLNFGGTVSNVRSSATSQTNAIAGSMARFMLVGQALYAITDEGEVSVFNVNGTAPSLVHTFYPWQDGNGWGEIETLFTFKENFFIGSTTGMLIYDISDNMRPAYISNYTHFTACDPVVANDELAFVTLRGGNNCGWQELNELHILDITDIMTPEFLLAESMTEPQGLTISNGDNLVFVCDGAAGLRVYDYSNAQQFQLEERGSYAGIDAFDVILKDKRLHVIGSDGLSQISFDASGNLSLISTLSLR